MKNKFFVGIEIVIGLIFGWASGVSCYIGCAIGTDNFFDDVGIAILITIMLVVFPSGLLIGCTLVFAAKIQIDEKGITKSLFGVKQKVYLWEEINHVKLFGNLVASSISFYKKRKEKSIVSHFSKDERIFFYLDDKRWEIINFYAPEFIKEMIEKAKVDLKKAY